MNEIQKNAIREADNYLKAAGLPTYSEFTQRPAAQTEREAFEAWFDDYYDKACAEFGGIDCTDPKGIAEDAWQARASLPAPQQADPRNPGWCVGCNPDNCIGCGIGLKEAQQATREAQESNCGLTECSGKPMCGRCAKQAGKHCAQCKKEYRQGAAGNGCPKCAPGVRVSEVEFQSPITTPEPVGEVVHQFRKQHCADCDGKGYIDSWTVDGEYNPTHCESCDGGRKPAPSRQSGSTTPAPNKKTKHE